MQRLTRLISVTLTLSCLIFVHSLHASPAAQNRDARDDAIFGAPSAPASRAASPHPQPTERAMSPLRGTEGAAQTPHRVPQGPPDLGQRLLALGTDRLQVGGLMLLRFNAGITNGSRLEDHVISMPSLVDIYLDARPNDRVRAFVRGRVGWNPSVPDNPTLLASSGDELTAPSSADSGQPQLALGEFARTSVVLNELWLKFDVAHRLFVTLGKQLLRWGASRFWNPTDVINLTQRPVLSPFDARNGVPLLKLHVPVEALGWNFYAIGVLDDLSSLNKGGVVGRAEFVLSTMELGLVGSYRDGFDPTAGLDVSVGIWNFDLTSELALRFDERFDHNVSVRATAGLQYSMAVFDDDMLVIGAEYFYNEEGRNEVDPLDLLTGAVQYLYAGRHYAALFASLPAPAQLDDWTFTASGIANLSDLSAVARVDVSVKVLTYLTVQAFAQFHMGKHGELRIGDAAFAADTREAARAALNPEDPTRTIPTQIVDLGLWLSVDL